MKRTNVFLLSLFAGIMLESFLANPMYGQTPQETTTTSKVNGETVQATSIPTNVYSVFKNSCMVCHGTGGRVLTLTVLNLSKWDEYDADKKAKKATAICETVTKGVMPPASFQRSNPTAVLTNAQKELICNWSKTLNVKK